MTTKLEEIVLQSITSLCPGSVTAYRGLYGDEVALCFSCFHKDSIEFLWRQRREISNKAVALGLAKWVILCLEGEIFYPPWRAITYSSVNNMIYQSQLALTDEEITKRILDSGLSCGLVDFNTNTLLCASQEIAATIGRDVIAIQGKNLDDLWDRQTLADLSRELKQQGKLEDFRYKAKKWVQKDGLWQTEEHNFRAQSIEVVKFLGRWCRLTYGIEVDD